MAGILTTLGGAGIGAVGGIMQQRSANAANRAAVDRETMVNLYEGAQSRQFNAQQAELQRGFESAEAGMARSFNAEQAAVSRDWSAHQAGLARDFDSGEARKQREWSAGQAQQQMAFQERMRGTQYQTAMADMRAAGLNPMLAYSQGGAGTPIGASGSGAAAHASVPGGATASGSGAHGAAATGAAARAGSPMPYVKADLPSLLGSALQVAQLENISAETEVKRSTQRNIDADTYVKEGERLDKSVAPTTYSAWEKQERAGLLRKEADLIFDRQNLTQAERDLVREQIQNAVATRSKIKADTDNTNANTVLRQLEVNEAKASSLFWGKYPEAYDFGQLSKLLGEALSTGFGLKRIFR